MSPVQSTDLLLINRTGVDYKAPLSQVKDGVLGSHVIQSATPPTLVTHPSIVNGTIWVDTSQSPPVINVWDPTANGGAGGWEELSSVPKPINPAPSDFTANPAFVSGTGTQADPFIITPSTVATPGGTAQSAQQLSLTGLKVGAAINWTDHSVGAGTRFQQTNGVVPASGNVSLRLAYSDTPNSSVGTTYTGNLQLGTTYFRWVVTQQATSVTTPTITSPSAGAVDLGDTPTFTSSAFAGIGTTHASSDWQVTLATDTTFASPVVQSMADAANLVRWGGGPLQANTDYIVRVRHNGGGISSAWSAVVAFKTKSSFIVSAIPGDLYRSEDAGTLAACTAPSKLISVATGNDHVVAVGTDQKVYVGANVAGALTLFPGAPTNVVGVAVGYDAAKSSLNRHCFLLSDGTLAYYSGTSLVASPPGKTFTRVGTPSSGSNTIYAISSDGLLYAIGGTQFGSEGGLPINSWTQIPLVLPAGTKIVDISCFNAIGDYLPHAIMVLLDNGDAYTFVNPAGATSTNSVAGLPLTGTTASPTLFTSTVKFKKLNSATNGGISAVDAAGHLWYGCAAGRGNVPGGRAWAQVGTDTWLEPAFAGYGTAVYALHNDGFIYGSPAGGNLAFAKLNYGTAPNTPTQSLGNTRYAQNILGKTVYLIIP
jgi:hypothetical protein